MRRAAPWLAAAVGSALLVAGVVVFWRANLAGWVVYGGSYAPLEPSGDGQPVLLGPAGSVLWTWRHAAGAGLVVLGLLVLAVLGGWALGRRSRARS